VGQGYWYWFQRSHKIKNFEQSLGDVGHDELYFRAGGDDLRLDIEPKKEFFDFANSRINTNYDYSNATCAGVVDDDEIRAVLVFHSYVPMEHRLDFSLVSDESRSWPTKELAAFFVYYVFEFLKVNRVQFYTPTSNEKTILLGLSLGFTHEANIVDWYGPGKPAALFYLLRDDVPSSEIGRIAKSFTIKKLH
jgi:RimJ/RimL family protein N-acetyltransferase